VEIRQVRYFVAVSECLNFRRAAEQLGVGQPAVSQQVARLERELGVILFDRSPRTVRLTEAGQRFLPEARAVLAAVERARLAAAEPGSGRPVQVLRLGTSTGMGDHLDRLLEAIRQSDPQIEVRLAGAATQARLDQVRAKQLDAAFVRGIASAAGIDLVPVQVWIHDTPADSWGQGGKPTADVLAERAAPRS
jgi:DNA-binding transcriptional LysR family regulator